MKTLRSYRLENRTIEKIKQLQQRLGLASNTEVLKAAVRMLDEVTGGSPWMEPDVTPPQTGIYETRSDAKDGSVRDLTGKHVYVVGNGWSIGKGLVLKAWRNRT